MNTGSCMPDESHIDEVLADYSRQQQVPDPSGTEGLNNMMAEAKQIMDAAMVARFTEDQAFQIARDYVGIMFHAAAQVAAQG
jgi:hypothetical protein